MSQPRKRKNPHAVALGSIGGKKRAKNQTPEERRTLASHAVIVREARRHRSIIQEVLTKKSKR
jgi:hypothetical protein